MTTLDSPVFKLEGVIHTREAEELEDFEGPLDLILYLLGKNKIEIQDIPIALILDQYLEYLEKRQQMDLEVASEFITMAAHLMYIKTRMLLNLEDEETQSEMDLLIQSLEERRSSETYQKVKAVAEKLGPMGEFGRNIMTKNPEPVERGRVITYHHQPGDLVRAFQAMSDRNERLAPPSLSSFQEIVRYEPYSVADKAREIIGRLKSGGITRFLLLFRGSRSRSEVVATFLAVLELCRNRVLKLAGGETDCTVTPLNTDADSLNL